MQFTNYKHRWENNIGKNTGLDNFSSLCARTFLVALHFWIIKINELAHNHLWKVMLLLFDGQINFFFYQIREVLVISYLAHIFPRWLMVDNDSVL